MAKERLTPYEEQGNTVSFLLIDDRLVRISGFRRHHQKQKQKLYQSLKRKKYHPGDVDW